MLINSQDTFSDNQTVTAIGDTPSTNSVDTGPVAPGGGKGVGQIVWAFVKTGSAVTSAGSPTVAVVLQDSADNAAFADVATLAPAAAPAALGANKVIVRTPFPVPLRRYLRLVYRVTGAVLTGGTFSAFPVRDVDAQQYMPSGFRVEV